MAENDTKKSKPFSEKSASYLGYGLFFFGAAMILVSLEKVQGPAYWIIPFGAALMTVGTMISTAAREKKKNSVVAPEEADKTQES